MRSTRIVVVDDSLTVRAVLKRMLQRAGDVEVVGEANNGEEAVALTLELEPDVVVMDLDMPGMDGLTASARIAEQRPTPIVVVSSKGTPQQLAAAFASVKTGVVGIFPKPEMPDGWVTLSRDLAELVRLLGRPRPGSDGARPRSTTHDVCLRTQPRVVAVGASTGGPAALLEMLREIEKPFGAGIAVVQHIAEGFEEGLAEWLSHELGLRVGIAADCVSLQAGDVVLAPSGRHLTIDRHGIVHLDSNTPPRRGHRPSVDVLFESLLNTPAETVIAVLLSGMGSDGSQGMLALRRAGALTLAQDEGSCAVYGMPRKAVEIGATEVLLSPAEIGRLLSDAAAGRLS